METSESVLEDLFETEELEDGKVDRGVKTKSSLVRTENGGELNTETGVDLASTLCKKKGGRESAFLAH